MAYSQLQVVSTSLNKLSIKSIKTSLITTLIIYKQLASEKISDEQVPRGAKHWIKIHDMLAIKWGCFGYFDFEEVMVNYEEKLYKEVLAIKTHKAIFDYLIKVHIESIERQAYINSFAEENIIGGF